jgi:hypothetical protein
MRRFVAALLVVTVLAGAAQARPMRPVPQQPKPTWVVRLLRNVIGPILVAGAVAGVKDLLAGAIRSAIVAAL